jgi:hypothetical protein
MDTDDLTRQFHERHRELVEYISSLSDHDFVLSRNGKWSPGQQLDHVVKCIAPLAKAIGSKPFIESKFGKVQRAGLSYDEVIATYRQGLGNGGKAPERFLPEPVDLTKREQLAVELMNSVSALVDSLESYSEEELDSLVLPHPFLGNLTIREMLCLMAYHAEHHREKTKENLKG